MAESGKYHLSWDCDVHTASPVYAARFSGAAGRFMLGRQDSILKVFLGDSAAGRVLDSGGGHGQNARAVFSSGGEYTALVSSRGADIVLREELSGMDLYPDEFICCGRLDKLPFADRSFDAAVSFRIVSHVPDWRRYIGELCRVSDKKVIVDFAPAANPFLERGLFALKGRFEAASRDFTTQRVGDIALSAHSAGFRLKTVEREFVLPMLLHRLTGGRLSFLEKFASRLGVTRFLGGPAVALLERMPEH